VGSSGRRFLVIVRAGENSLHRQWLAGAERNWDLVVSWYGTEPYAAVGDERVLNAKGWKWDVLAAQFAAHPELADYDYVWVPDDDIETDAASISGLFRLTEQHRLATSQPGLTDDSYFSVLHTMRCASFTLRYTTFVEVMAPCLSRETLRRALPYFADVPAGTGLSHLWTRLDDDNSRRSAIIDAIPMRHTRPVGVFLNQRMRHANTDAVAQAIALHRRFGLDWLRRQFFCYAGIGRRGGRRGQVSTALHMLADYLQARHRWVQPDGARQLRHAYTRGLRRTEFSKVAELAGVDGAEY
jgi:hypothetical protein